MPRHVLGESFNASVTFVLRRFLLLLHCLVVVFFFGSRDTWSYLPVAVAGDGWISDGAWITAAVGSGTTTRWCFGGNKREGGVEGGAVRE